QLNHPHVCTLYDAGEQDAITYLVLELVDGETLAARLERARPLRLQDARAIAIEVAEALDAAHRLGIVHRDLKPSNVMLTRTGAKLIDFGIAKASAVPFSSGRLDDTNPRSRDTVTAEGTLLGTIQYIAPEQLEGREADARSDLFSFGAV